MKKLVVVMAVMLAGVAFAENASLAAARGKIGEAIADPAKMTELVKGLSAADQKEFLAEVNDAISKMPGSTESKAATFLNVNRAALKGAKKGNLATLLAEVFATVPPEALVTINESFGADLFNRNADPSVSYTDKQFTDIALKMMEKINERTASTEDGAARSCFAVLMFLNASNGSPVNLAETLINTLPSDAQNVALTEWVPAATGENQTKSYEPILGASSSEAAMPQNDVVIRLAGPQLLESMLGEVVEGTPTINTSNNPDMNMSTPVREQTPSVPEPAPYEGQSI